MDALSHLISAATRVDDFSMDFFWLQLPRQWCKLIDGGGNVEKMCVLILHSVYSSFGVFVAFMTNSYLQHGVENATTVARYGINDTTNYLQTASHQLRHLLVDNYDELKTDLEDILTSK